MLDNWLAQFYPSFIGLTGSDEDLVVFQRDLGMNPATTKANGHEQQDYGVNHASNVLAFPANSDTALIAYPAGATSEDYASDLLALTSSPGRYVEDAGPWTTAPRPMPRVPTAQAFA